MSKKIAENGIVRYRFYRIVFQKRPYRLVSFSVSFFRNDRIVFGIVRYRFSGMTVSFSVSFCIVFQEWPYRFWYRSVSFFRNDRIVSCRNRYRFSEMTVSFRVEIGIDRYRFCRYRKLKVTFWDPVVRPANNIEKQMRTVILVPSSRGDLWTFWCAVFFSAVRWP